MAYVYQHIRLDSDSVFYIGIGSDSLNYKRSKSLIGRNKHWHRIVNKCGYRIEIIHDNISLKQAFELEKMLICKYGRVDINSGCLVNMSDGGEGNFKRIPWNKGIKTGIGGFKGERTSKNRDQISKTLKSKGIRPKPYIRTENHKKKVSDFVSKYGAFVVNNPNVSHNWVSFVLFDNNRIEEIYGFKSVCAEKNIDYNRLLSWSRRANKKGILINVLHPKYGMRVLKIRKKL